MKQKLLLIMLFISIFSWGQISEGYETGQSTSGYVVSATLSSGTWTGTDCLLRSTTSVHGGNYSSQLKASTGVLKTPSLNSVGTVTFWCNKGTGITVSKTVSGTTTGLSVAIGTAVSSLYPYTVTVNDASTAIIITINNTTSGVGYIDDFSSTAYSSGFTIIYSGNTNTSGTVPTDATSYVSGATATVKTNSGTLAKTGYTFAGWNTLANGSGTDYAASGSATFSISANTILYAKWIPNNNIITFNGNGATSGSMSTQTIATAATANLTANGFSRIGYTFAGWATTPTGAVAYTDGASYTMGLADVTLYAVWNTIAPFITTSGTLTALSTTYGTASGNTTFTVSAGNLTSNLIITAPTGFEVSLTAASGFATSINLGASDRTNTTIYVRLAATTDFGTYSGDVVVFSTILTSVNVATVSSNVTKKPLTISGLSGVNKVYDGTTTAALLGTPTLIGVVSSDDVTLSGTPTSNFIDKNVGTLKAIIITGYTLAGTKAANYSVSQPTGVTGNITTKSLSITTPSIASKVYDGSAVSGAVTVGTLSGFISPETVTATATGVYADANAGTGKSATVTYVLSNGTNGGLATNYSLATGSGTGDITQANPVFSPLTLTLNVGGAQTILSSISNSNGVLSFISNNTTIATVGATTGLVTSVAVGTTTINVSQAATINYFAGSTIVSVSVNVTSYVDGDWKSTSSGNWSSTASGSTVTWSRRVSGSWVSQTLPTQAPTSGGANKVYIYTDINLVGSNTAKDIVIGVDPSDATKIGTLHAAISTTFGKIVIEDGGTFSKEANGVSIDATTSGGVLEVKDGGTFLYKHIAVASSAIWAGDEKFHANSIFKVVYVNSTAMLVIPSITDVSTYTDPITGTTACFGNIIIDCSTGKMNLVPGGFNLQLTHKDLIFRNNSDNTPLSTGDLTTTIGGDLIIENTYNINAINFASTASTLNITVKGNFIHNGTKAFRPTNNLAANSTFTIEGNLIINNSGSFLMNGGSGALIGTSTVNLKGDLIVSSSSIINSGATGINNFNFTGIGDGTTNALTQSIDVLNAATASNINFNVNSGSYTKLINQDFALGTNSAFAVKTGGTFDFGFNGAIPLNLIRVSSQNGQTFTSESGSILKITSPLGITIGGNYTGNIQVGTNATSRSISSDGTFHYIGKASQVTGSGLPNAASNKHVIVELAADNLEFTSSNGIVRFNNPATAIGSNFKGLEIRKGTVIADDLGSRFEDSATSGEVGNLKMTGGIYKIFTKDVQPAVSGNYDLSVGSKIIFGHTTVATTTQAIRGGTDYQYPEIEVEGKDVRYSNIGINMKSNGLFTVKENAILTNTGNVGQIVSLNDTNPATLTVKNTGIFKTEKEKGFSGIPDGINPSPSVRTNHTSGNVLVVLEPGSVVEYSRSGDQIITNATVTTPPDANYQNLTISGGSGIKTLQNPTSTKINEDLTVTSSKLLLNVGEIITVKKGVKIASGGAEFEIKNKGQLIQLDETDTNTGIGFKYNRIAQADHDDYIYWSSPVDAFNLDNILGADRYFWNPLNSNSNGTVGNWNVPSTASAMQKARGYIVKVPNSFPTTGPSPLLSLFEGKPNNGSVTFDIARAAIVNSEDDRWNLTGNPYPSAIDAEQFLTANNTKINGAVWVWTHGQSPTNTVNPYYQNFVYNYYASDYVIYNKLGSSDPNTFAGKIAAGQGFMVNMLTTATTPNTISFSNAMRTDASLVPYNNADFYKTSNSNLNTTVDEKHRIWIDILNTTDGQKDRILLGYATNATLGKDHFYDCFYSPNSTEVGIYTLINADPFSIQGRPLPFTDADLVPLGVSIVNAGNHKIALSKVDGLFETGQNIYLEDSLLHIIHDLKASPYSFTSAIGTFNDRFVIRYTNATLSNHEFDVSNNTVLVAVKNNKIIIKSAVNAISSIDVYDVLGREITKLNGINQKEITLSNVSDKNQALILKITLENGLVVTRKIIL